MRNSIEFVESIKYPPSFPRFGLILGWRRMGEATIFCWTAQHWQILKDLLGLNVLKIVGFLIDHQNMCSDYGKMLLRGGLELRAKEWENGYIPFFFDGKKSFNRRITAPKSQSPSPLPPVHFQSNSPSPAGSTHV